MEIFREPLGVREQLDLRWRASEIVRELDDRPHLLLQIEVSGGSFPHMNAEAFVRLLRDRDSVQSWFADVADDNTTISGYFPVDLDPVEGIIEYGYGDRVFGRIAGLLGRGKVELLDRERLPRRVVVVTEEFIRQKQAGRRPPELRMPEARQPGRRSAR